MSITESGVRAQLRRKGYLLCKSRCRTPDNPTYGLFDIVEPFRN